MSIIYLLNTHNLELNDELINELDKKRKQKVLKTNELRKKQELVGAYLLLKESLYLDYQYDLHSDDLIYNENGKPYLKKENIYFSLSHSNGIVALVINKEEIGLDIEEIKDIDKKVINNVLNEEELAYYRKLNEKDKLNYFYEIWCSKEAYIKKKGLSLPLKPKLINLEENCLCRTYNIINKKMLISVCGLDSFRIIERHLEKKGKEE